MAKIPPQSYSTLSTYELCPHKYYRTKLKKDIKEDFTGAAATWGREVHKAMEDYFKYGMPLRGRMASYKGYAEALGAIPGKKYVEHKVAIDADENPTTFFADDVAHRGVLDLLVVNGSTAYLVDHKTGKPSASNQLKYNALLIFPHFPEVEVIKAAFFWLPTDSSTREELHREDVEFLWNYFEKPLVGLEHSVETNTWPKTPNALCGWCPVTDCEYWRERK